MEKEKTLPSTAPTRPLGLVIPMDVEALCIGTDPGAIFQQTPYNFGDLVEGSAYLSSTAAAGGPVSMTQGVHLHWALPDALAQGQDQGSGPVYPATPDRWLVTRYFCSTSPTTAPQVQRWVVESNYYAADDPNPLGRASVTVPSAVAQGDDWEQPWRHLGRVVDFASWHQGQASFGLGAADQYADGLTAVGWGQPDFAASYQNSKNIMGFTDLGSDLTKLVASGDMHLSYHVVGWYSNPADDPVRQMPGQMAQTQLNEVLSVIPNADDKAFVASKWAISAYVLVANVAAADGPQLRRILQAAGYPVDVDIPVQITPAEWQQVMANTTNPADQALLEANYPAQSSPVTGLSDGDKNRLWEVMSAAGFNFLQGALAAAKWSLPSGTVAPLPSPAYSLYSATINNVVWNAATNYFQSNPASNFNIAVGNTAGEALSALIANTSGGTPAQVAIVEEVLDALQAGILQKVKSESMLSDWEELKQSLHNNAFGSTKGGMIWQVQASKAAADQQGEATLPDGLAKQLNDLNLDQQKLDAVQAEMLGIQAQVFLDWYRFMLIYYYTGTGQPPGDIDAGNLAQYINERIARLGNHQSEADALLIKVNQEVDALKTALGSNWLLNQVAAPRYWQPTDPVLLFQGDGITPSDRFGNDGRYMADDTLVCRLTSQLLSAVTVAAGALGNTGAVTVGAGQIPGIPNTGGLPVVDGINAVLADGGLLNEDILATQLVLAGSKTPFATLEQQIEQLVDAFLGPAIPQVLTAAAFNAIGAAVGEDDRAFWQGAYVQSGDTYTLIGSDQRTDDDNLRLVYILNSAAYNPSSASLAYTGLPFSEVGTQVWDGNPWMPYSLQWTVFFYPILQVASKSTPNYPKDFITSQFKFGDTDLVYTGPSITPSTQGIEQYSNTIYLTPHANINLQVQLSNFIANNPNDPILAELQAILKLLDGKPVLSQALSGYNKAMVMLQEMMQLPVADPNSSSFYAFTNTTVAQAVGTQNLDMPAVTNSYNPIRTGLMQVSSITLVDVFGRNVTVQQPSQVIRSQDMQQTVLQPSSFIYFPPRLTEAARLLFRWLSADDDTVEMNTHPATTPICGWVLANHLDSSLWIYDNLGNPYGSLVLNYDRSQVLWQATPGSPYWGLDVNAFFKDLGVANPHLEALVLGLYGDGKQGSAQYLDAFMRALDMASVTIEPDGQAQYQANAVLMGTPLALVRASLDLQLAGIPAFSQSYADLANQVNAWNGDNPVFIPGNDYGFTEVDFPVKIGDVAQTQDGLYGYFKDDDYGTFYCAAVPSGGNAHVLPPADDNLVVQCAAESPGVTLSLLIDPRGEVHATTGILPVKAISIPPDQFVDAMSKMQLAFLTAPILSSKATLAMPLPSQTGGFWSWVENDGQAWSALQQITAVTTDATMDYMPQQLLEGWLNLSSILLTRASYALLNLKAGAPVIYITNDPQLNAMTLTFVNKTGVVMNLAGGPPVPGSYQAGGSSLVFNFGDMVAADVFAQLDVRSAGWAATRFNATANTEATWGVAPQQALTLQPGDSVVISIQGITCAAGTTSGNLKVWNFAFPTIPDSLAPVLVPVAVIPVPPTH